jgi:hypothetical protein
VKSDTGEPDSRQEVESYGIRLGKVRGRGFGFGTGHNRCFDCADGRPGVFMNDPFRTIGVGSWTRGAEQIEDARGAARCHRKEQANGDEHPKPMETLRRKTAAQETAEGENNADEHGTANAAGANQVEERG